MVLFLQLVLHIFKCYFKFRQQFYDWKILALFHCHLFEYPTIKQACVFSVTFSPRQSFIFVYLFIYFSTETSTTSSHLWIFMFEIFHVNVPYMRRLVLGFSPSYRSIRLTQCRTQFKPFGYKTFCFRNFRII